MKYLDIFHCSTSSFAFPIFKVKGFWSVTPGPNCSPALRQGRLSPPSPKHFPCDFDIAPITHVTMRPIYSLDAGENPCRLSLMEPSYVRWVLRVQYVFLKLSGANSISVLRFRLYSHATLRQGRQVLCDFRSGQPSPSRQEASQGVKVN